MKYSTSMRNRISFLVERGIGSQAVLAFYAGEVPESADDAPTGEKLGTREMTPAELAGLREGRAPEIMPGTSYWRVLDNGGLVVMQGEAADE